MAGVIVFIIGISVGLGISVLKGEEVQAVVQSAIARMANQNCPNMAFGLNSAEAIHFAKKLTDFMTAISLEHYEIDKDGWIYICYEISGIKIDDDEFPAMKRAICLELHNYLMENHGIDTRSFFISTLTDTTMIFKIAASPISQRVFQTLKFVDTTKDDDSIMTDDEF